MTHKPCGHNGAVQHTRANHADTMVQCDVHNDRRQRAHNDHVAHKVNPNAILFEEEGVGPSAKGQRKRTGREQFFFLPQITSPLC